MVIKKELIPFADSLAVLLAEDWLRNAEYRRTACPRCGGDLMRYENTDTPVTCAYPEACPFTLKKR